MATDICTRRLTKELAALKKDPIKSPKITVEPNETNILEVHYVIEGSPGTPYEGGVYHGKLVFPKQYPLKPPDVIMITPSGRFQTNRRLCLSMSSFHPETWNPMWSVQTILMGLHSFMIETSPTLGSIETSNRKKRELAAASLEFNVMQDPLFCKLFPDYVEELEVRRQKQQESGMPSSGVSMSSRVSSEAAAAVGMQRPREGVSLFMAAMAGVAALFSIALAVRFL